MAKTSRGFFRAKREREERTIITEARGAANQDAIAVYGRAAKRVLDCAVSSGVFSVGTDLALFDAGPSLFSPSPRDGNKRAFPVAFTLTAISRAPSAARRAQPGRSRSLTNERWMSTSQRATTCDGSVSQGPEESKAQSIPDIWGAAAAAGKGHRRGCAEGRRKGCRGGVVCPRA